MLDGGVWELYGGVLAQAIDDSTLSFTQLPSEIRGIPSKSWVVKSLPGPIRDFVMDPSQDLLVIAERQQRYAYFRTLTPTTHHQHFQS